MKFSVRIKDLAAGLKKAKITVSPNDSNPLLQNFALRAENNRLTIIATDLQLATVCVIDANVERAGGVTVPGMKFIQIVDSTSADELELELDTTKNVATTKTGAFTATLVTLPMDDYPRIDDFNEESATTTDRESMLKKLDRISFSVSDNEAKRNLLAVFIDNGLMQATDGNVTTVLEFDTVFKGTLIPALAVKDLVRILKQSEAKEVKLASTDNFLLFKLADDVFMTRLSSAKFPDIPKKIIAPTDKNDIILTADKAKLRAAIKRVGVTASEKNEAVCFDIMKANGKPASLKLTSQDTLGNASNEEMDVEFTGDSMKVYFNFSRILDVLDALNEDKVSFKMSSNRKMPVRVEEDNPKFMWFTMRLSEQILSAPTTPTSKGPAGEGEQVPDEI